jgi:hypothetical protein
VVVEQAVQVRRRRKTLLQDSIGSRDVLGLADGSHYLEYQELQRKETYPLNHGHKRAVQWSLETLFNQVTAGGSPPPPPLLAPDAQATVDADQMAPTSHQNPA